jgi:hypothetical protein
VVDPHHPANASVLRRLMRNGSGAPPDLAPDEVADHWTLGTHPDLLSHFWYKLPVLLDDAERCRRIVYGRPALVSPVSGVVFGTAGGTHAVLLRLPPAEQAVALAGGATRVIHYPGHPRLGIPAVTDDLAELGEGWVFCNLARDEQLWCVSARAFADEGAGA